MSLTETEHWFLTRDPRPAATARLYCLPYAGGGASAFAAWGAALGAAVEVCAVALPGRERRIAEPAGIDPAAIAEAVAGHTARDGLPFAFYGHSLGARLAFEVARELRRAGEPQPVRLFVGAARPPDAPRGDSWFDGLSEAGDAELVERLRAGGGVPAGVLADPELLDLLLPVFRADFGWLDGYVYRPEPPLDLPVTAFAGTADPAVGPALMAGWSGHGTGQFTLRSVAGGHFFVHDRLSEISSLIRVDLAGDLA